MIENDLTELEIKGEARIWKVHLERDAQTRVNIEAARAHLSTELLAQISSTSHVMSLSPQ